MLRSSSVIDTAAELVTPPTVMSTPIMPGLDKPEATGKERDGGQQRRDQRDQQELRRTEMDTRQVQREDDESEPRTLGRPDHDGEHQQGGKSRKRIDGAHTQAFVAVKDRLGQVAQDSLSTARAHHQDHADTGEADRDADDHIRDQDPRRFGAEDHRAGGEQKCHQHDEVDEPLGDDRAQGLAHRDVQLLLGEISAVDVAHLRRHDAVDEE